MKRRFLPLVALLVGWSCLNTAGALGQSISYPDSPSYEKFRRSELDTLQAISNDPSRALTYRLLISQRRLREAQLMIAKGKLNLVPSLLKDYQETVKGIRDFLNTLPLNSMALAGYYQTVEATRARQEELLKHMAKIVPTDLHPSIEAALAASQQLRSFSPAALSEGFRSQKASPAGSRPASLQGPTSRTGTAVTETQPEVPVSPEGVPKYEILQPKETPRPLTPDEALGRRLRPFEPHTRGTRRPNDTQPRPRAREPIRRRDR